MPCSCEPTSEEIALDHYINITIPTSALCAICTILENDDHMYGIGNTLKDVLKKVDWQEAGIKREEFEAWWKRHKQRDEVRRKKERKFAKEEKAKEKALAKLTVKERKALGIK